jgi:hypothetical protein
MHPVQTTTVEFGRRPAAEAEYDARQSDQRYRNRVS